MREIKNLFEFFLIPFLAVLLPQKIYFSIFKSICKYTFFYKKYSQNSYSPAHKIIQSINDEVTWNTHVKLLYLVDFTDFWLARFRPKKLLKQLNTHGHWNTDSGHLAMSLHWGTGYITLLDLKQHQLDPHFVYTQTPVDFKYQSFFEKTYRKARTKHINKLSGSVAISTGGGYNKIIKTVANGGVPILLFDAPQFNRKKQYQLSLFNKKYNIAKGFVNLICHEKIDYQLYFVKLNFSDGSREMTIKDLKNTGSEQSLLSELSCFFEELLKDSPEQWFFWRQSDQLFEENINE